jgi:hypothetical protein
LSPSTSTIQRLRSSMGRATEKVPAASGCTSSLISFSGSVACARCSSRAPGALPAVHGAAQARLRGVVRQARSSASCGHRVAPQVLVDGLALLVVIAHHQRVGLRERHIGHAAADDDGQAGPIISSHGQRCLYHGATELAA